MSGRKKSIFQQAQEWDSENNAGVREIRRLALRLVESTPLDQKAEAITTIGHIAYVGGREPSKVAFAFLPHFFEIIRNPKYNSNHNLRIATLKSLCEICHGNRQAKELLIFCRQTMTGMKELIENTNTNQDVRVGRWACYLLALIITSSTKSIEKMCAIPDIQNALIQAADYRRPWTGWGMNMADLLLKLAHIRDPKDEVALF